MKILIGSLLFATAIFINFSELNSSPQPSSEGSPSNSHVSEGSSSHRHVDLESDPLDKRVSKRAYINLYNKDIEIDLIKVNNIYVGVDCRVISNQHKIPTANTKSTCNFMTQADSKRVGNDIIGIVIYVQENIRRQKILLGAKLPPTGRENYHRGDPRGLNPDHTNYFITYGGVDYEVKVDPVSQKHVDVKLWGRPNLRPNFEEIMKNWHQYSYIHFNGVYILLFIDQHYTIQGAALDPFWNYRPGEQFAHINPHDHLIRRMQPHTNFPVEQRPGQHQSPVQLQYANAPLHFDPNQNWNYPPYHPPSR